MGLYIIYRYIYQRFRLNTIYHNTFRMKTKYNTIKRNVIYSVILCNIYVNNSLPRLISNTNDIISAVQTTIYLILYELRCTNFNLTGFTLPPTTIEDLRLIIVDAFELKNYIV